jgi:hypothetical protein
MMSEAAASTTRLPLALIRRDGGTQPRDHVSSAVATAYAEDMRDGAAFPPVIVYFDGAAYWLADGFHRVMAVELIGGHEIDAEVRQGTRRDAILFSVGANAQHGYRRSNDDKRRVVRMLLDDPEWAAWSDREIARRCYVGADMVGRMRPSPSVGERQIESPMTRKVMRGGTAYEMSVAGINEARPVNPEAPMQGRGSKQLRVLLGEIRGGADIDVAAAAAGISPSEAREHLQAENKGEYRDVAHIVPLAVQLVRLDTPSFSPCEAPPQAFDFVAAQTRQRAMDAIAVLAKAPPADEVAAIWARFLGPPVPSEIVETARSWLDAFADLFPAADAHRREVVAKAMEKL